MKTRDIFVRFLVVPALAFCVAGCSNWLDVKPDDRVIENELFKTEDGFLLALNGIYIEMNHENLYGGSMLFDGIEVLGQQYALSAIQRGQGSLANFDYSADYCRGFAEAVWTKAYSLIMNVNKLLDQAEARRDMFTGDSYELITGEALGLRAFLHFDLLRLFGPVYSTGKDKPAIPYYKGYSLNVGDILTAEQALDKIIDDLLEAEVRLAVDPVIDNGPMNSHDETTGIDTWRYRSLRMNYYAVKALQARAYLYGGHKAEALAAAKAVVDVQEEWFPFTPEGRIVGTTTPDRVFSSELIFCMQNTQRGDIYTELFSIEGDVSKTDYIYSAKGRLNTIYGTLRNDDWRYSQIWQLETGDLRTFRKYETEGNVDEYYTYLLPLIRVTEMYYIIAETTADEQEALDCINLVLVNRGLPRIDATKVGETIAAEYRKEFFGEGQYFFYAKRVNAASIYSANTGANVRMDENKYQLPLPESEVYQRD